MSDLFSAGAGDTGAVGWGAPAPAAASTGGGLLAKLAPGIGLAGTVLGLGTSLAGLFGAAAAQRRAEQERQQYLSQMASEMAQSAGAQAGYNRMSLMGAAGMGGDAINAMGKRLGSSLSNAGVYNSTGIGGALVNAQRDQNASLADMGARMAADANQQRYNALSHLSELGAQYSNEDLGYNRNQLGQAAQGFGNFLSAFGRPKMPAQPGATDAAASGAPPAVVWPGSYPSASFTDGSRGLMSGAGGPSFDGSRGLMSGVGGVAQEGLQRQGFGYIRSQFPPSLFGMDGRG